MDTARLTQLSACARELPNAMDDWSRAVEAEQPTATPTDPGMRVQQPQPVTAMETVNAQCWTHASDAANEAIQRQKPPPVPTQRVMPRPLTVVEVQPPTTTVEATRTQATMTPDTSHTVSSDQILVVTEISVSGPGLPKQDHIDVVARDSATTEQWSTRKRRIPFGRSIRRTGSRFLAVLRGGVDEASVEHPAANQIMTKSGGACLMVIQQEAMMEDEFSSFKILIEEGLDAKYKGFGGEGSFLIYDESVKFPVKKEEKLTEEEVTWLAHGKKDEEVIEFCDPQSGSIVRQNSISESPHISGDYMDCSYRWQRPAHTARLENGRTYACVTPIFPDTTQPVVSELVVDDQLVTAPSTTDLSKPLVTEPAIEDGRPQLRSPPRVSRLPRRVSAKEGSRLALDSRPPYIPGTATQPPVSPKSRSPLKGGRKDSAQLEAPQSGRLKER